MELDFRLLFERAPGRFLVLAPEPSRYAILAASDAYLGATCTTRDIISRALFEVFPDNPADPHADGVRNLDSSLQRALERRATDVMAVQHYDIRDRAGAFVERHWSPANAPVVSGDARVVALIHRVEDVTDFVREGRVLEGEAARLEHQILLSARSSPPRTPRYTRARCSARGSARSSATTCAPRSPRSTTQHTCWRAWSRSWRSRRCE
jgi:hypothetical protein